MSSQPLHTRVHHRVETAFTISGIRTAIADLSINLQVLARDRESVDTLWRDLRQTRAQVVDLERRFHAYTLAAVIAWEASSA